MALEPHAPRADELALARADGRIARWIAAVFVVAAVGLIPWTVWLTWNLPERHVSEHWDLAWGGFDVLLALSFGATGLAALRRSTWLGAAAAVTGTLLLVDAWFDVVMSTRSELDEAILEAVALELPIAVLCFAVARDAERFRARVGAWATAITAGIGGRRRRRSA